MTGVSQRSPVEDLLGLPVGKAMEEVAHHQNAPAAGWTTAMGAAFAAAVVTMVARASRTRWPDAGGAIAQAEALRVRLCRMAVDDAAAFRTAQVRLARVNEPGLAPEVERTAEQRAAELAEALRLSAQLPLEIAEAAADVAALAAWVAAHAIPEHRPDAVVAAVTAEGAARGSAHLVTCNQAVAADDPLALRAAEACERAAGARADVLA